MKNIIEFLRKEKEEMVSSIEGTALSRENLCLFIQVGEGCRAIDKLIEELENRMPFSETIRMY